MNGFCVQLVWQISSKTVVQNTARRTASELYRHETQLSFTERKDQERSWKMDRSESTRGSIHRGPSTPPHPQPLAQWTPHGTPGPSLVHPFTHPADCRIHQRIHQLGTVTPGVCSCLWLPGVSTLLMEAIYYEFIVVEDYYY